MKYKAHDYQQYAADFILEELGRSKYLENYICFLNIIAMICKNKYFAFGNIQTMV